MSPGDNVALKNTNAAPGKGEKYRDRLTVDMALRIVADVLERRDMAPRKRKSADEDEIDALVDDLDDELDEDEDVEVEEDEEEEEEEEEIEDEVDDDDFEEDEEDPDEAPKRSRSKKSKTKKAAPEKSGVGTVEVAEAAGITPRQLRMYLRAQNIQDGDSREGRYHWPSLKSKEVQKIIKDIQAGAVDKLNKEKLSNLKSKKKSTAKKTTAKKSTKKRVRAKA